MIRPLNNIAVREMQINLQFLTCAHYNTDRRAGHLSFYDLIVEMSFSGHIYFYLSEAGYDPDLNFCVLGHIFCGHFVDSYDPICHLLNLGHRVLKKVLTHFTKSANQVIYTKRFV